MLSMCSACAGRRAVTCGHPQIPKACHAAVSRVARHSCFSYARLASTSVVSRRGFREITERGCTRRTGSMPTEAAGGFRRICAGHPVRFERRAKVCRAATEINGRRGSVRYHGAKRISMAHLFTAYRDTLRVKPAAL